MSSEGPARGERHSWRRGLGRARSSHEAPHGRGSVSLNAREAAAAAAAKRTLSQSAPPRSGLLSSPRRGGPCRKQRCSCRAGLAWQAWARPLGAHLLRPRPLLLHVTESPVSVPPKTALRRPPRQGNRRSGIGWTERARQGGGKRSGRRSMSVEDSPLERPSLMSMVLCTVHGVYCTALVYGTA